MKLSISAPSPRGQGRSLPADERILRSLDAGAVAGTWFWDVMEDRFTADSRFARRFSLDADALEVGVRLAEVVQSIHPEDEARVQRLIARALAEGGPYRAEYRVMQADGSYCWIEAKGRVELDAAGRARSFPGILVDIDERKQAELLQTALLELGDRLRALGEAGADEIAAAAAEVCGRALGATRAGYGVVDALGESVKVGPDWRAREGAPSVAGVHRFADFGSFIDDLSRGELVAILDVASDARTADHAAAFEPLGLRSLLNVPLMSGGRLAGVFLVHQESPREWTLDEVDFVRGAADRTWAAMAAARAVGELRSVNGALEREVQQRTRDRNLSWRLSKDMMLVARFDGSIAAVNPAWHVVLGWTEQELLAANFLDIVHPGDRERTREAAKAMAIGADFPAFENRYLHKDGSTRWISWSATPGDGVLVAAGRDVTEARVQAESLRSAEEALRQSQKMEAIGQLTGGVAHDFNNVLAVVKTSIDLLRRVKPTDDRRHRFMDAISDAVGRATRLTGQLLAFARRQALQPSVFDAGSNARSVAEMIESLAGAGIALDLRLAADACFVKADPSQFDTALVNLSVNARDAMGGAGTLTLRVEAAESIPAGPSRPAREGAFVAVTVADTGSGIAPEHLGKIFEPFFTTKGVGHGTGLGLSQVFGFARQSGGDVRVESVVGRGSSFTLYLPRADCPALEAESLPAEQEQEVGSVQGQRVLVVEDNADLAASVEHSLAELGYSVAVATNAEGALALLRAAPGRFAAVFSDVVMAGMSGIEMGREIARAGLAVPVVLTSGYSNVLARSPDHGFALLPKPYSLEDLARALREAIRGGAEAGAVAAGVASAERERLSELDALRIMDTEEEEAYDELVQLAAEFCDTPIALISLVDGERQWFKAKVGLQARETPRELAFCAHAIQRPDQALVVPDASRDDRFSANLLVTGDPNIRFYAGAPLVTSAGHALGTLCVIDRVPRELERKQLEVLRLLAGQVIARLEARRAELGLS